MNETVFKTFGDVATVTTGYSFRGKAESNDSSSGVRVLQIKDIKEGVLVNGEDLPYANTGTGKTIPLLAYDQILMPLRGERQAALLISTNLESLKLTTTQQVAIITINSDLILPSYLHWYLNSEMFKADILKLKTGMAIKSLTLKGLAAVKVPVPVIYNQEKIVQLYNLWKREQKVLNEMLINGSHLTEAMCKELF